MPNMHKREAGSRARRWLVAGALGLVAAAAGAMEDESMYSYTKVEADAGRLRGVSGSVQSIGVDGWAGGDVNRLWYQFDGQAQGGRTETAAVQLLYGRYIAPFWDAQIGLRHDQRTGRRDALAVGVRGLAPYAFDVDLKLYLRDDGRLLGLSRFENDILLRDERFTADIRRRQMQYLASSTLVNPAEVRAWPTWKRVWYNAFATMGPLL